MDMSSKLHSPASWFSGKNPSTRYRLWMGPRTGLDVLGNRTVQTSRSPLFLFSDESSYLVLQSLQIHRCTWRWRVSARFCSNRSTRSYIPEDWNEHQHYCGQHQTSRKLNVCLATATVTSVKVSTERRTRYTLAARPEPNWLSRTAEEKHWPKI